MRVGSLVSFVGLFLFGLGFGGCESVQKATATGKFSRSYSEEQGKRAVQCMEALHYSLICTTSHLSCAVYVSSERSKVDEKNEHCQKTFQCLENYDGKQPERVRTQIEKNFRCLRTELELLPVREVVDPLAVALKEAYWSKIDELEAELKKKADQTSPKK